MSSGCGVPPVTRPAGPAPSARNAHPLPVTRGGRLLGVGAFQREVCPWPWSSRLARRTARPPVRSRPRSCRTAVGAGRVTYENPSLPPCSRQVRRRSPQETPSTAASLELLREAGRLWRGAGPRAALLRALPRRSRLTPRLYPVVSYRAARRVAVPLRELERAVADARARLGGRLHRLRPAVETPRRRGTRSPRWANLPVARDVAPPRSGLRRASIPAPSRGSAGSTPILRPLRLPGARLRVESDSPAAPRILLRLLRAR